MQYFLYLLAFIVVMIAQMKVNSAFHQYKQQENEKGLTGAQVARRILDENGLHDVSIEHAQGVLSDHYDPKAKVVRLSNDIYYGATIAAISVAAHESSHAIQHAENYGFIALRNSILPFCALSSNLAWPVLLIGLLFSIKPLAYFGIGLLLVVLAFQVVTLPVEFNASSRAMTILANDGMIYEEERADVKSMLSAAAMTYVAAVISSAIQILRFLLIINRNRD
ncbi:MAG: zinc metallopeptidase [Erysipelotrichaceae bacterium]|nr:zinc metallopeptidase [Erysipelotrichaceae bacterium]